MKLVYSIYILFALTIAQRALALTDTEKSEAEKQAIEVLNERLEVLDSEMKELLRLLQVYELTVIGDEEEEHDANEPKSYNVLHHAAQVAHVMEEEEETERRKRDAGLFSAVNFPLGPVPKVSTLSNRGKFYELNHMRRHKKGAQSSRNLAGAGQTGSGAASARMTGATANAGGMTGATANAGGMTAATARARDSQAGLGQNQGAFNAKQLLNNGEGLLAMGKAGARAQTGKPPMTRAQAAQARAQGGQAGAGKMGKQNGKRRGAQGKGKLMSSLPAVKGMRSQQMQMQQQV